MAEWEEVRPTLEEDKRFGAVALEEERKRLFEEYIQDLKQRARRDPCARPRCRIWIFGRA